MIHIEGEREKGKVGKEMVFMGYRRGASYRLFNANMTINFNITSWKLCCLDNVIKDFRNHHKTLISRVIHVARKPTLKYI